MKKKLKNTQEPDKRKDVKKENELKTGREKLNQKPKLKLKQLVCFFTRLESLGYGRVSDSHVSAETVYYEDFVLIWK